MKEPPVPRNPLVPLLLTISGAACVTGAVLGGPPRQGILLTPEDAAVLTIAFVLLCCAALTRAGTARERQENPGGARPGKEEHAP